MPSNLLLFEAAHVSMPEAEGQRVVTYRMPDLHLRHSDDGQEGIGSPPSERLRLAKA